MHNPWICSRTRLREAKQLVLHLWKSCSAWTITPAEESSHGDKFVHGFGKESMSKCFKVTSVKSVVRSSLGGVAKESMSKCFKATGVKSVVKASL